VKWHLLFALISAQHNQLYLSPWSDTKLLVAAIDFGSSGAGYAFLFLYQFKNNPIDVQTSIWSSGTTSKIPCVLLFDESKKIDCLGFDAEDKYEDLFNNDEHDKW
jgi:hypothetical protein